MAGGGSGFAPSTFSRSRKKQRISPFSGLAALTVRTPFQLSAWSCSPTSWKAGHPWRLGRGTASPTRASCDSLRRSAIRSASSSICRWGAPSATRPSRGGEDGGTRRHRRRCGRRRAPRLGLLQHHPRIVVGNDHLARARVDGDELALVAPTGPRRPAWTDDTGSIRSADDPLPAGRPSVGRRL
jgi:hypothetical protein